jgi:hypothetical protein
MAFDAVELGANVLRRDELVKDVACLDTLGWQVPIVILKRFDYRTVSGLSQKN